MVPVTGIRAVAGGLVTKAAVLYCKQRVRAGLIIKKDLRNSTNC
jgi:hypothetical protein